MNAKRHWVAIGIGLALALLFVATTQYPGGSQHDAAAPGFDWRHNYLCNLLDPLAVNGMGNLAQPWAVAGLLVLSAAAALFFVHFSSRIPDRGSAKLIRYTGTGAMAAGVFAATPYHDVAVTVSGILLMLCLFYITVYTFRSGLHGIKVLAALSLLALYATAFVYYTQLYLAWLPILQKAGLLLQLWWILALEYFSGSEDFQSAGSGRK